MIGWYLDGSPSKEFKFVLLSHYDIKLEKLVGLFGSSCNLATAR